MPQGSRCLVLMHKPSLVRKYHRGKQGWSSVLYLIYSWPISTHLDCHVSIEWRSFLFLILMMDLECFFNLFSFLHLHHISAEWPHPQTPIRQQFSHSGKSSPSDLICPISRHWGTTQGPQPHNFQLSLPSFLYYFCLAYISTFIFLLLLTLTSAFRISSSLLSKPAVQFNRAQ